VSERKEEGERREEGERERDEPRLDWEKKSFIKIVEKGRGETRARNSFFFVRNELTSLWGERETKGKEGNQQKEAEGRKR
jgi:hypothetical protein